MTKQNVSSAKYLVIKALKKHCGVQALYLPMKWFKAVENVNTHVKYKYPALV